MEGGPASNVYSIPTAMGFVGHTLIKHRLPSMTIGRKIDCDPVYGHGLLYDLRDHTRFGKLHRPNYDFGGRRKEFREWAPAPNHYRPDMSVNRPKAPEVSFKGRTLYGRVECNHPAPNAYTLKPAIKRTTSKAPVGPPRFPVVSEGVPAPNAYHLPPVDAYKYGRQAKTTIPGKWRKLQVDSTPSPTTYRPAADNCERRTKCVGKTFGRRPSYKRSVYLTAEDLAC